MNRPVKEEYLMLREEIMECMKSQASLSTFVSATICTYLAAVIALKKPDPLFYLVPFLILVPASLKEAKYQLRIAYLASYLIVFLEGPDSFLWETRYHAFSRIPGQRNSRMRALFETFEFTLFSILCYVLFLRNYQMTFPFSDLTDFLLFFIPIILIGVIAWSMFNYQNFRKTIEKNIIKWKHLQVTE